MNRFLLLSAAAIWMVGASGARSAFAQQEGSSSTTSTTVTGVTGTIAQLNYGNGGQVQGFLVGTDTLLSFPRGVCGGLGTLGAVGNSVTYSGTEVTSSSGFNSVIVSSFTNNTTKATYTAPTKGTSPTVYGPTSGTLKQLNYSPDGAIDGFLFSAGGSTIFVSIGYTSSTTLTSLLTVGATVSVTGDTFPTTDACSSTGALESVSATSLTVGSTTVVIQSGGPGRGHGGSGGGPGQVAPGWGGGHE
jgi:hypothetical protein